jgi:CDP-glucose 4,6-dehydratase
MRPDAGFWSGKRVLVTGHTGFKGGWLTLWLARLGAAVTGVSLPAEDPSLFAVARIGAQCKSHYVDIRDMGALSRVVLEADPEIVFHLAAQPLVLRSYAEPLVTWQTNVLGTLHLLEAIRARQMPCAILVVTSDKCYENTGRIKRPFAEPDALGGHDPYSSSKAATEVAAHSWYQSFFASGSQGLATARAGNVIGGGDWAADRLFPDMMRAIDSGLSVDLRHPAAVRPWQHVLEPLYGYLQLAAALFCDPAAYSGAWNFGPATDAELTVLEVVEMVALTHPKLRWTVTDGALKHEAASLTLDSSKASSMLRWIPRWSAKEAVAAALHWYDAQKRGADATQLCVSQIDAYVALEPNEPRLNEEVSHGA